MEIQQNRQGSQLEQQHIFGSLGKLEAGWGSPEILNDDNDDNSGMTPTDIADANVHTNLESK